MAQSIKGGNADSDKFKNFRPVTSADFDQNYEPISPTYPAATGSTYTVRSGDTLKSIAQAVWGDSAMWYLIASANDLSGRETLVAGQVLTIPNKVTNIHNNAQTFRPYNPGEVIGHVDPTLPTPPPPADTGCGGLGTIIMIAIAVVVTVYTAGAASTLLAGGSLSGVGAGAIMSAGTSVLTGGIAAGTGGLLTASAAGLAGAAIGGAVGSIASQAVGMAMGNVDTFSWKAVGLSALGSAVGAGVGQAANAIAKGAEAGSWGSLLKADTWTRAAISGAASSAVTQAMHGKWSWREVAASAVGSAAGFAAAGAVSDAFRGTEFAAMGGMASRLSSGMAGAWASNQVRATDPNYTVARMGNMFVGVLGNVVGDGLVEASQPTQGVGPWSSADNRNGSDIDSDNAPAAHERQAEINRFLEAFGDGSVSPVDRSNDALLADAAAKTGYGPTGSETLDQALARVQANRAGNATGSGLSVRGDGRAWTYYTFDEPAPAGGDRVAQARMDRMQDAFRSIEIEQMNADVEAAAGHSEMQRELNRFAAMSQASSSATVWNMRDASAAVLRGQQSSSPSADWDSHPNWFFDIESNASLAGHVALGSQLGVLGWAKTDGLSVLQRAAPLLNDKQRLVGAAGTLSEAATVFKNPAGATAQSLAQASIRYGGAIRSLGYLGTAANVVEETAFVVRSSEGGSVNAKALAASATNIAGDAFLTLGGIQAGAAIGALFVPFAPITIPVGAALGGFAGHYGWDTWAKPFYRELWTGVPEPEPK